MARSTGRRPGTQMKLFLRVTDNQEKPILTAYCGAKSTISWWPGSPRGPPFVLVSCSATASLTTTHPPHAATWIKMRRTENEAALVERVGESGGRSMGDWSRAHSTVSHRKRVGLWEPSQSMYEMRMSTCVDSSMCPTGSRWEGVCMGRSVDTLRTKISKQTGTCESRSPRGRKCFG